MAVTKEDIATRAFRRIGANSVTDFDDPTQTEAEIAGLLYEDVVQGFLGVYPWTFAKTMAQLSRDGTAPLTRYDAAYQIPTNALLLRGVFVQGEPIDYEVYGGFIYCDASADDIVIAEYIARVDESVWPPYFTYAITFELAAVFGGAIARDADLVGAMQDKAEVQFRRAKSLDAQAETSQTLTTRRLINVR